MAAPCHPRHPRHELDPVLAASPLRLSLMTALNEGEPVRYRDVANLLDVRDAVLSHECAKLLKAGYLNIYLDEVDRRVRWLQLTGLGQEALYRHANVLRRILDATVLTPH